MLTPKRTPIRSAHHDGTLARERAVASAAMVGLFSVILTGGCEMMFGEFEAIPEKTSPPPVASTTPRSVCGPDKSKVFDTRGSVVAVCDTGTTCQKLTEDEARCGECGSEAMRSHCDGEAFAASFIQCDLGPLTWKPMACQANELCDDQEGCLKCTSSLTFCVPAIDGGLPVQRNCGRAGDPDPIETDCEADPGGEFEAQCVGDSVEGNCRGCKEMDCTGDAPVKICKNGKVVDDNANECPAPATP